MVKDLLKYRLRVTTVKATCLILITFTINQIVINSLLYFVSWKDVYRYLNDFTGITGFHIDNRISNDIGIKELVASRYSIF
ncbi:Hypothetical predicted protein [Octopus vulgaris]|uniref:Uncharacterized protein n=1 Tax=Octopus vulgaris TaxID=6645 RepID=A0AA36C0X6_OCTVU|nr:Hypothetical predicted protein [Octopus vulgaris]